MTLCPTCNTTLYRKHDDSAKLTILRCPVCKVITAAGCSVWVKPGPGCVEQLVALKRQADENEARRQLFMEAPCDGTLWTDISLQ